MKNGPYTLLIAPANYPGKKYRDRYIYEHHLVWWKTTGDSVPAGYEIHHKNGNHKDNNPGNLQLLTAAEHRRHHGRMRTEKSIINPLCNVCGKIYRIRKCHYNYRLRNNKRGVSCSKKCGYRSISIYSKTKQQSCGVVQR